MDDLIVDLANSIDDTVTWAISLFCHHDWHIRPQYRICMKCGKKEGQRLTR